MLGIRSILGTGSALFGIILAALPISDGLARDCTCSNLPTASSTSDDGFCECREMNIPSCTIRWFHAIASVDSSTAALDRAYVDALAGGEFGVTYFGGDAAKIRNVLSDAASRYFKGSRDLSPTFHAAAYLENTRPENYDPDALLASLAVLLGAGVGRDNWKDPGMLAMLTRLYETSKDVYARVQGSMGAETDGVGIDDLSAYGCFEFAFRGAPPASTSTIMIKTPFAPPLGRCQQ
jgi:hypothetical protein